MAGTITVSTISDGTNSTSSTNCIQGSAKAWAYFTISGSTCTVAASYNVSSITYNGAGIYTANFTTAISDANYAVVASISAGGSSLISDYYTKTTTTVNLRGFTTAGSSADSPSMSFAIFR